MANPTDEAPDLAMLREAHPNWFFAVVWAAAASGPDRRLLIGQRDDGTMLVAYSAESLSRQIDAGELDLEPYCTTCGDPAGRFIGMDGWHHHRTAGGKREVYDAGHEPVIGWRLR